MNISINDLYSVYQKHPKVTTDSRDILPNSIFFALKGENFDGNKYAEDAIKNGAAYAVIDDKKYKTSEKFLLTRDVLSTLQELALYHRKQLNLTLIGITGTNGKTTTKELIARVLESQFNIKATTGNLNNHIGVPLTLLSLTDEQEFAVVEMGANHPGEIDLLCNIAQPDYGIITNIGKAHLEGFGSFEGVIRTKGELYDFLRNINGKVFINSDNEILAEISDGLQKITYGTTDKTFCKGEIISTTPFVSLEYKAGNVTDRINSKLFGGYNFENILAAITIGKYFGVSESDIKKAIESYEPANNRSQILKTESNTVIMDAYNANPTSMRAAIDSFTKSDYKDKMLILGDMLELGEESRNEHIKILNIIEDARITDVILVGPIFCEAAKGLNFNCYNDSKEAATGIKEKHITGKAILLKASRGIRLESIVKYL
jgi:UDP-N-acetylmuramoyl-tripeptide--D-alanyl-D-alanine ligase